MRVFYLTAVIIVIDQISKLYIKGISVPSLGINFQGLGYGNSIELFGSFFQLTFIENPGMAFGLEIGGKLGLSFFTVAATIIIIYFIVINKNESRYLRISLAFILGGAVGNLIDRIFYGVIYGYAPIFYGKVVDFFHLDIPDFTFLGKTFHSWPIFNIADISVSVGFVMIIIGYKKIFHKEYQSQTLDNIDSESRET